MTREEFLTTLKLINIKEKGGEFRIKGFLLDYIRSPISDYVLLKGRIPYSLAKTIYAQYKTYHFSITDPEFQCPKYDENARVEKYYVSRIQINSPEALKFVIEAVRNHPFINEWAIGNY